MKRRSLGERRCGIMGRHMARRIHFQGSPGPERVPLDALAVFRTFAHRFEMDQQMLRARYEKGPERTLRWQEINAIVARQLPPYPPWDARLLLDVFAADRSFETCLRFGSTTVGDYGALPGGSSPSGRENVRKLAAYIIQRTPGIEADPNTYNFAVLTKPPLRFPRIAQFAEYDHRILSLPRRKIKVFRETINVLLHVSDELLCPYCRAVVAEEDCARIECQKCGAIHHDECWQQNGGCAIFGCGLSEPPSPGN